jgi:CheY-like chemotaxis protein
MRRLSVDSEISRHALVMRVLIVEGDVVTLNVMGDYLRARNYAVDMAMNGTQALAVAPTFKPSVILMDIQMPGMDGMETMRLLRAMPEFVRTPIIALSAWARSSDRERCLAAGANEYLVKPVNLKHLVQTIEGANSYA